MSRASLKLAGLICLAVCLAVPGGPALADGPSRPVRPEEKTFHAKVAAVLAAALPAGPPGWDQVQRLAAGTPSRTIPDAEHHPWRLSVKIAWQDTKKTQTAQRQFAAEAGRAMQAQTSDPEYLRLHKQGQELAVKLGKAVQAQDQAEVAALQRQLEDNGAALKTHVTALDQRLKELRERHAARDAKAALSVEVNAFSREFHRPVTLEAAVRGRSLYRAAGRMSPEHGWREGESFMFLGPWQLRADARPQRMEAAPLAQAPYLSVQTIVVRVEADPARARALLEAVDWKALEGLLEGRP